MPTNIAHSLCRLALFWAAAAAFAQGTLEEYRRAFGMREQVRQLDLQLADTSGQVPGTNLIWYRRTMPGGYQFVTVTPEGARQPLLDAPRMAEALTKATGTPVKPERLPFSSVGFSPDKKYFVLQLPEGRWRVHRETYVAEAVAGTSTQPGLDGLRGIPGPEMQGVAGPVVSPDGKWAAEVVGHNVWVRTKQGDGDAGAAGSGKAWAKARQLTFDGNESNSYQLSLVSWAPDSRKLVAHRVRPGQRRKIAYIESSPANQLQPKFRQLDYAKPGDVLDVAQPVLLHPAENRAVAISTELFPDAYSVSRIAWRKDSSRFHFEYNQRGHQVYRVIAVDAATGAARALITEAPKSFFCYSSKKFLEVVNDGKELLWMSERDGWNHLYLYDGETGTVKNQITKGNWVVRSVAKVDEAKRQIWFSASGMHPGQDPYYLHWFRINFDGTGLTPLTNNPAVNHAVTFTENMSHFVDIYSTPTQPPVAELRQADTLALVATLERGTLAPLVAQGWRAPEPIVHKGRDGNTDIYGILYRPYNFDASKRYPVLEYIYAGPHDSFVPKTFSPYHPMQMMADLGFVVVQIDGMGTSNRSKAFHDVSWKNLGDSGFPDRQLWHKAVASRYAWYDLSRLGIYGHSAGGQSSLHGLLLYPELYKAAASSAGCHDNRMDKIWWNEQWMGWPLGPEYVESSNVTHAHKLQGKLLLAVGELDTNVDPASTLQVVNALIGAGKTFDLLFLPGKNHGGWGDYWERKRADFFVRELMGVRPPEWNVLPGLPPTL